MPKRARPITLEIRPSSISYEEAVRRVAHATEILMRISQRIDRQKADGLEPISQFAELRDCRTNTKPTISPLSKFRAEADLYV